MPGNAKAKCPKHGNLYVEVRRQRRDNADQWVELSNNCAVFLAGGDVDKRDDSTKSDTNYNSLCAGSYTLSLTPAGDEASLEVTEEVQQKKVTLQAETAVGSPLSRAVTIEDDMTRMHYFKFYVCVLKVVIEDEQGKKLEGIKVKPSGGPADIAEGTSDNKGLIDFGLAPRGSDYTFKLNLNNAQAQTYVVQPSYGPAQAKRLGEDPFKIQLARKPIFLQINYKDPAGNLHPFPKNFPVTVVFTDPSPAVEKRCLVGDDKGNFDFKIEPGKTKFTLKFDSAKVLYLVHKKSGSNWVADDEPLLEEPDDNKLRQLTLDGKRFFSLPKKWSLPNCQWEAQRVTVPADGKVVIPDAGIGTKDSPGKLTLLPKGQFVRLEYFDRKHRHKDGGNKPQRVSIPPIVLKGARTADASGNPADGVHDVASNWTVEETDLTKACQVLPWVVLKNDSGADLPKLNKDMLLEFGWPNGFICAEDQTDVTNRKIEVIPANDDKRKPTKDRAKYYDLPTLWKSRCYFTRFADANKNKFFDDLTPEDIEVAYDKTKPLTFSLDDIVLVDGTNQALKDKDESNADQDLSQHSRIALLELDPEDKYKVKVYKPRNKAAYWSESEFKKEAATDKRRNAIVDYPANPRVVVFCSGFYDIFDKRTSTADFTKKEILGARAAKLQDTDISSGKVVLSNSSDVTNFYVHLTRVFHLHYLHYGATDGTTVFGAILTYYSCRFKIDPAHQTYDNDGTTIDARGSAADVTKYREEGMERAMKRWNEKDYYFEEADDKTEILVKHFCLFEAKDIETSSGVFVKRGGTEICMISVTTDAVGSSATDTTMQMRRSGALDEGQSWGSAPGTLPAIAQYDVANAAPKSAFAHEMGHAAIGVFDDYVTGILKRSLWKYTHRQASMDMEGQRYYGMPYELDQGALMNVNRAVNMRYLWGRANWLNDQASAGLNKFLAAKKFRMAYEPAGKPKLKYFKPDAHKSIYKPLTEPNVSLDKRGRCDFHLYHLGDDEFARILPGGPYNGILAVGIKISARFVRILPWATAMNYAETDLVTQGGVTYACASAHTSGTFATDLTANKWAAGSTVWVINTDYTAGQWVVQGGKFYMCNTNHNSGADFAANAAKWTEKCAIPTADLTEAQQFAHLETLKAAIDAMLARKYKFTGAGDFAKTYLRVFTQWEIKASGTAATARTHFTMEFGQKSRVFQPAAQDIKAGLACNLKTIVRYLYGKIGDVSAQWTAEGGVDGDLTKADLTKFKNWMDTNGGGTFTLVDV